MDLKRHRASLVACPGWQAPPVLLPHTVRLRSSSMLEVRVLASGRDLRAALNVAGPADDPPQAQAAGERRTARYLQVSAARAGPPNEADSGTKLWPLSRAACQLCGFKCRWRGCPTPEAIPPGLGLSESCFHCAHRDVGYSLCERGQRVHCARVRPDGDCFYDNEPCGADHADVAKLKDAAQRAGVRMPPTRIQRNARRRPKPPRTPLRFSRALGFGACGSRRA
jgi:hypothetical protein